MKRFQKLAALIFLLTSTAIGAFGQERRSIQFEYETGKSIRFNVANVADHLVFDGWDFSKLFTADGTFVSAWVFTAGDSWESAPSIPCFDSLGKSFVVSQTAHRSWYNFLESNTTNPVANNDLENTFSPGKFLTKKDLEVSPDSFDAFPVRYDEKRFESVYIPLKKDFLPHRYQIYLVVRYKNSQNVELNRLLKIQFAGYKTEFFPGESQWIVPTSTFSLENQRRALLSLLITGGKPDNDDSNVTALIKHAAFWSGATSATVKSWRTSVWDKISSKQKPDGTNEVLEQLRAALLRKVGARADRDGKYIDTRSLHLELYDSSVLSYTKMLIHYYSEMSESGSKTSQSPLRSFVGFSRASTDSISATNLVPLDEVAGNRIAQNALRYLTGAIDYTNYQNAFSSLANVNTSKADRTFSWSQTGPIQEFDLVPTLYPSARQNQRWSLSNLPTDSKVIRRVTPLTSLTIRPNTAWIDSEANTKIVDESNHDKIRVVSNQAIRLTWKDFRSASVVRVRKSESWNSDTSVKLSTNLPTGREKVLEWGDYAERGYDRISNRWLEYKRSTNGVDLEILLAKDQGVEEIYLYLKSPATINNLTLTVTQGELDVSQVTVFETDPFAFFKTRTTVNPQLRVVDSKDYFAIERYNDALFVSFNGLFSNALSLNATSNQGLRIYSRTMIAGKSFKAFELEYDSSLATSLRATIPAVFADQLAISDEAKAFIFENQLDYRSSVSPDAVRAGKPVLYTSGGTDDVDSFNQKVWNRYLFRVKKNLNESDVFVGEASNETQIFSSSAVDAEGSYLSAPSVTAQQRQEFSNTGYPFVFGVEKPRLNPESKSPFQLSKRAGVDSFGLVTGALVAAFETANGAKPYGYLGAARDLLSKYKASRSELKAFFSTGQANSTDPFSENFRPNEFSWTREDLETMTTIVGDLAQVRKGDLVVGEENDVSKVGIVVAVKAGGARTTSDVVVVTSDADFGAVHLAVWGNDRGSGGFSAHPERYTVRRILVGSEVEPIVVSDVLDYNKIPYRIEFDPEFSKDSWYSWIPNTGEPRFLGQLKIKQGDWVPAGIEGKYLSLVKPLDRGHTDDATKSALGNVYNNSKVGHFALIAHTNPIPRENGHALKIQDGVNPYIVDLPNAYSGKARVVTYYFNEGLGGKTPYKLLTDTTGTPGVLKIDRDGLIKYWKDGESYSYFSLWIAPENCRPGDDLILQFSKPSSLKGDLSISQLEEKNTLTADSHFFSVYDKKLMWRANLYMKQNEPEINSDWNDLHPWVGSLECPNEWNNPLNGYNGVAGGQLLDFPAFTWPGQVGADGSLDGQGIIPRGQFQGERVSYDFWGADTPADYRTKLFQQKTFLGRLYSSQGVFQGNWSSVPVPAEAQQWSKTSAPDNVASDYHNYVKVIDRPKQSQADFPHKVTAVQQGQIGGYPYIPGFSYWYDYRNGGDNPDVAFAAAGLDCVAFVHRAIQASQAQYTGGMLFPTGTIWQDSNMTYVGNPLFDWRRKPEAHNQYISVITSREQPIATKQEALKKVIPGDIWYYQGHIGIVKSASEDGNANEIRLIEAVYNTTNGIRFGGAVSFRTLADLTSGSQSWVIGRLK